MPKRDIAVGPEGTKLTLGDTTVEIVATPGHTPGTLSYVFPVKDQGRTVMVAYSGGTLTGAFGTDARAMGRIHRVAARIAKAAAEAGASVLLSNHSEYDGAYTKARLVAAPRQPGEDHPFIVGRRRRAALLHGDDGVRDGVKAAGRREIARRILFQKIPHFLHSSPCLQSNLPTNYTGHPHCRPTYTIEPTAHISRRPLAHDAGAAGGTVRVARME